MSDLEESKPEVPVAVSVDAEDCSNEKVIDKYRIAGDIAQTALKGVMEQCLPGKTIYEICQFGDAIITHRCSEIFKSHKMEKGIAFPTCVSPNHLVCHYTPLETESIVLKAGDWVKIDLGCHIDGYIAVVAQTYIVPETKEKIKEIKVTDEKANVIKCAYEAAQICARLIKPGNTNTQVTQAMEKIAACYNVKPIYGTVMHQLKRFVIDATKMIGLKHDPVSKLPEITFEPNESYAIDVCFTTGVEKTSESESRITVFKRQIDKTYQLKMKASRSIFSEIQKKFSTLPFSVHKFDDPKQARMGIVECIKHSLVLGYPILEGHDGDAIAHFKMTVLLTATGNALVTSISLPEVTLEPSKKIEDEEFAKLITQSLKPKKNKKKST